MDSRQRFRDFALRLTQLELERLRKSEESAAMQEAATERRRLQDAARAERVKRDEERMKEAEIKRENERREREIERKEREEEKVRMVSSLWEDFCDGGSAHGVWNLVSGEAVGSFKEFAAGGGG